MKEYTHTTEAAVIPKLKEFQIWNDSKRKHYHYESENVCADIMPHFNGKSGYFVSVIHNGKIVLDTDAKTPQQAAQMCSDKKLKAEPSETHWTKENAFASLTSDAFLVADMNDKHTQWYIFYPEQRKAKISLADGDHFITSMNHSLTDEQILAYYKIGQKINIGKGENDYYTTISDVQILQ